MRVPKLLTYFRFDQRQGSPRRRPVRRQTSYTASPLSREDLSSNNIQRKQKKQDDDTSSSSSHNHEQQQSRTRLLQEGPVEAKDETILQPLSYHPCDSQSQVEFRESIWAGRLDRAQELVEKNQVNVNFTDGRGMTPLIHLVCIDNNIDQLAVLRMIRFLLGKGAHADVVDKSGRTALAHAVTSGKVGVAEVLLQYGNAPVDQPFRHVGCLYSPLGLAISRRNLQMVALLLRFGANTVETLFSRKTYSALFLACWLSTLEIVRLLLEHHNEEVNNVNTITPRNSSSPAMSPLCKACQRDNMEMARFLVENGARTVYYDGVYPSSPCPLKHAVERGSLELVRFLLDHSAYSASANARALDLPRATDAMIGHPLSPPLDTAIRCNKLEAAQLLVERGANVNDAAFGFLNRCACYGQFEGVRLLLRAGANVNRVDGESGETPLYTSAKNGNAKLVKEFLRARANLSIRNRNGETPLGVAHRKGHVGVVYLLLRTSPHIWPKLKEICKTL